MTKAIFTKAAVFFICMLVASVVSAQAAHIGPPAVGQTLVREGDLAIRLAFTLGLSVTEDEVEAEGRLAEAGIAPVNGWIADYPLTPDIIGEIRDSVLEAVSAGRLKMATDEALKAVDDAVSGMDIAVKPYVEGETGEASPTGVEKYPNPTVINNYYHEQGPPVITYYQPPAGYYSMYTWVPYPFWWVDFWFPGYFILHDFHKVIIVKKRVVVITNHFRDRRVHRSFRIDPAERFRGRTFGGIGARNKGGLISTGQPRSDRRIFNRPEGRRGPSGRGPGEQMIPGDRTRSIDRSGRSEQMRSGDSTRSIDRSGRSERMRSEDRSPVSPPQRSGSGSRGGKVREDRPRR